MVSVGASVLMWLTVAGLSEVNVTSIIMKVLEVTGMSLTSINCDKQSATLL